MTEKLLTGTLSLNTTNQPYTYWSSCAVILMLFCNYNPSRLIHDKTNKMACAPSEDTDQPAQPADLSLRWAHSHFYWVLS